MPVAGSISALDRDRSSAELERREFDLVLIGGGISGAGTAHEAATGPDPRQRALAPDCLLNPGVLLP